MSLDKIIKSCSQYQKVYNPTYITRGNIVQPSNISFLSGGTYFSYNRKTYTVLHVTIDGQRTIVGPTAPDAVYKDSHHFPGYTMTLEDNDRPVTIQENGEVRGERLDFVQSAATEYGAILTATSVMPIKVLSVAPNSILYKHLDDQRTLAGNSGSPIVALNGTLIGVLSTVIEGTKCKPNGNYEQKICLKDSRGTVFNTILGEGQINRIWEDLGIGVYGGITALPNSLNSYIRKV